MRYPIKLNDGYTCQGYDADGRYIVFDDLLGEGERVGPSDGEGNVHVNAYVVRREDGLWVEAL
jgi:hypothetical protein